MRGSYLNCPSNEQLCPSGYTWMFVPGKLSDVRKNKNVQNESDIVKWYQSPNKYWKKLNQIGLNLNSEFSLFFDEMAYAFFWNAQKSKNFIYGSFSALKLITCFFECPLFYVRFFETTHFSHFQNQRKNGVFQKN